MAFSDAQRTQIRRYLGYSDLARQVDLRLEAAMDGVSPSGEGLAVELLCRLDNIETKLQEVQGCLKVVRVEDVYLAHDRGVIALRQEGNRYVMQLSDLLYTKPRRMPFGSTGGSGRMMRG